MRSAAGQVESFDVRTAIGWLEGPQPAPVRCNAVYRAIQDAVAVVNIDGGQPSLKANMLLQVGQSSRTTKLFEDDLAIVGEKAIPVVMRTEEGRVDENIQGFATWGSNTRLGPSGGANVAGGIGSELTSLIDGLELLVRVM